MKLSSKSQKPSLPRTSKNGFTILEIMVVMAIILGLAGISFSIFSKTNDTVRKRETETIIEAVSLAMVARSTDISPVQRAIPALGIVSGSIFPAGDGGDASTEKLVFYISGDFDGSEDIGDVAFELGVKSKLPEVVIENADSTSYIKEVGGKWLLVDSWDTPIRYTFPGDYHNEDNGFDLESAGPDKEFGSGAGDPLSRDNIILK